MKLREKSGEHNIGSSEIVISRPIAARDMTSFEVLRVDLSFLFILSLLTVCAAKSAHSGQNKASFSTPGPPAAAQTIGVRICSAITVTKSQAAVRVSPFLYLTRSDLIPVQSRRTKIPSSTQELSEVAATIRVRIHEAIMLFEDTVCSIIFVFLLQLTQYLLNSSTSKRPLLRYGYPQ